MSRRSSSLRHGFTLVELLVVIGIIGLLISILLPSLRKAKEQAASVKCMSNLKQLANATVQYVNDNKGLMPAAPGGTPTYHVSGNVSRGVFDFIAWHRTHDPMTGRLWPGEPDLQITDSALAKYLGRDTSMLEAVFRCPSDEVMVRPNMNPNPALKKYRYSYSMNTFVASKAGKPKRVTSIKNGAAKVLFVCEDEKTLDDGLYHPQPGAWATGRVNGVADRHRLRPAKTRSEFGTSAAIASANEDCLGNVAFVDGHAEIFSRKDALRQKHTDNPATDPVGF